MRKLLYIIAVAILIGAASCTKDLTTEYDLNIPIVEAYLNPYHNIDHVKISNLIPYISYDTNAIPLNDLFVYLKNNSQEFKLELLEGDSGYYYYPGNDLKVIPGEEWELYFDYNNYEVSATTIIPAKPENYKTSDSEIYLEKLVQGTHPGSIEMQEIDLSWDLADNQYYYLTINNLDDDPELIIDFGDDIKTFPGINVIEPSSTNIYTIKSRQFTYFGNYEIILYVVNQEYVDLYENTGTSSLSLGEPFSNINNGKGIFTAYNSDTLYIDVKKK